MSDDPNKPDTPPPDLQDLVRDRPFDLAEAIGRQAGGLLKGASPVAARDRALFAVARLLETRLPDPEGSLVRTILTALGEDAPLLALHYDDPPQALREYLNRILSSDSLLTDLVRATDARWGQDYQEHPRFDQEGSPPSADDPYTGDQVRSLLERLREDLDPAGP